MKIFIRTAVAFYVIAGVVLAFADPDVLPVFYQPSVMSTLAFVSALLIVAPRAVFWPKDENGRRALERLQGIITAGLIINGFGGLGLYKLYRIGFEYDKFAHFVTSLIFTIGLVYFLRDWFGKNFRKAVVFSSLIVLVGGILWEFLEALSDIIFDTNFLGGGTGAIRADTTMDMVMNVVGIAVGIIWVVRRKRIAKG